MQINVTFLIQIINFWITYIFVSRLLLKPVYCLIQRKKIAKKYLLEKLKQKEQQLLVCQNKKKDNLVSFRNQVKASFKLKQPKEIEKVPEIQYMQNKKTIKDLIEASKKIIVKKVTNAH